MNYMDFVLIVDKNNKPCIPIKNGKAGYLLREHKAEIINHEPLVIKRTDDYNSDLENRDIFELKVDSGYLNIGFSVSDNDHEYIAGQVKMLNGMSNRLLERKSMRSSRRNRLRYRKNKNIDYKTVHNPTYKNGNEDGWFAPSIVHKMETHIRIIEQLKQWVPIDKVIVEVAKFDIAAMDAYLKDGTILNGKDYQNGEMKGYENVVSYVRARDNYSCYFCNKKKKKDGTLKEKPKRIEVHHKIPRSWGGTNNPGNLICVCQGCHQKIHSNNNNNKYFKELLEQALQENTFKDSTYMNIVRWELLNRLTEKYPELDIEAEYGYNTKINRKEAGLRKFHYNDAVCVKEFKNTTLSKKVFIVEQKRCNDRKMENFADAKYIDSRDGKKKSGNDLKVIRHSTKSKRSTNKEHIDNERVFRKEKVSKGKIQFECHSYCVKPGDLIYIKEGKHKGKIAEVSTIQIVGGKIPNPIIDINEINNKKIDFNRELKKRKTISNMTDYQKSFAKYQIRFTYKESDADGPSITLTQKEYEKLKENKSDRVKIIRTRRGLVWREYDRLTYEAENMDQEEKKLEVKNKKQELKAA